GLAVPAAAGAEALAESIDAKLSQLERDSGFAGVVLVATPAGVLLEKGFGLADREAGVPFTPATVSTVGSITKQFTGAAILALREEGRLALGDPLHRFFPAAPPDKRSITLHQLLTHTAGFPGHLGADEDYVGRVAYLDLAFSAELLFEPGSRHRYSNVGYSILAAVIEGLTGGSYEAYLRARFFDPLGMTDTGYTMPDWDLRRVAKGYRKEAVYGRVLDKQAASGRGFSWHLVGNGGIHSTVRDLGRWVVALRRGEVLEEESLRLLFGRHVDEGGGDSFYGYGWVTFELPSGETMIGHDGGNGYLFADLNLFPERADLFFAILVNDPRSVAASGWIRRLIETSDD
ncbi:MAG: serine hydrolase domain-containing protein, partial [Thermoanaerobaculia bacterium]|nr:serine hydrolase domain-containing protein [Thermoanaerobaculia bacterium]